MVQILLNSLVSLHNPPKFCSYAGKLQLLPNLLEEVGNAYENVHYSFPLARLLWLSHPVIEIIWLNCCTQRVNSGVIASILSLSSSNPSVLYCTIHALAEPRWPVIPQGQRMRHCIFVGASSKWLVWTLLFLKLNCELWYGEIDLCNCFKLLFLTALYSFCLETQEVNMLGQSYLRLSY